MHLFEEFIIIHSKHRIHCQIFFYTTSSIRKRVRRFLGFFDAFDLALNPFSSICEARSISRLFIVLLFILLLMNKTTSLC